MVLREAHEITKHVTVDDVPPRDGGRRWLRSASQKTPPADLCERGYFFEEMYVDDVVNVEECQRECASETMKSFVARAAFAGFEPP